MKVSKQEVISTINQLKSIDLKSAEYLDIRQHTDVLVRAGFLGAIFPENILPIYRGRVVDPNKVYHNVEQISYPPKNDSLELSFNRLSTNRHQVFYGALMPQEARFDQITAMIEVGSIMKEDFNQDEEYIQIGKWVAKEKFPIAIVGLHSQMASLNPDVQTMKKNHTELIQSFIEGEVVEMVAEFMSHEFSKKVEKENEWEYKISAAYGDGLFDAGIKAIQFPSVKAEGRSFNVALHKDLVDHAIEIEVAAITRLRKINKEIIVDWFLQSPTISNGRFRWEEPPRSAVTGEPEMRIIRKIMAQNGGKFINPQ